MISLAVVLPIAFLNLFNNSAFKTVIDNLPKTVLEIASDSAFAQRTTNFAAGQTVYVRAAAANDGVDKHVLNLRDSGYGLITSYQLERSGNQFLTSFSAPSAAGTYSLEANIVSGDSVINLVQTIQVGGGENNSSNVKVKIENKVNSGNQVVDEQAKSPDPTPSSTPAPAATGSKKNFFEKAWQAISDFFSGIFKSKFAN